MFYFFILYFVHRDASPVAEGSRALEILAESVPEPGIAVDRRLRLLRLVLEDALPRRERGEGERVPHVDLARERQRRGLRPRALRDHRRGLAERSAHRFRDVVAVEHGDERHRAAALLQDRKSTRL